MTARTALRDLARLYGVQTSYEDVEGRRRTARTDALTAVLRARGAPLAAPADAPDALRARRQALWRRGVEPVAVAWDGGAARVPLRHPATDAGARVACRLELAGGGVRRWDLPLEDAPVSGAATLEGTQHQARVLEVPGPLPTGYHRLSVEWAGHRFRCRIIAAPRRAYGGGDGDPRAWGVFLPLYALRTRESWGVGDFSGLGELAGWAADEGANFVGTLPLLASFLDEPFEPSPYVPVSRLFWNELFVDVARIPEVAGSPAVQTLLNSTALARALEDLRGESLVDYRRAMALKRQVLEGLADHFFSTRGERREAFERFIAERPRLEAYARFRAVTERRREAWPAWPEPLRSGVVRDGDYDEAARRYHLYVQWIAHRQLSAAAHRRRGGAGLYLDLPLGVHRGGFDTWNGRDLFALDASAGAPPDPFFTGGQNWGFPPLDPDAIRRAGYRYTIACIRHHLRHARLLRLDHVMSLHRLFWVPGGFDATDGVYVRYRPEELYAILSVESHRHRAAVVGEDLGTVPRAVRSAMARHGLHRMFVVQAEAASDRTPPLPRPPRPAIASVGTHDMPTFAAFFEGRDIDERAASDLLDQEEARRERCHRSRLRRRLEAFLAREGWLRAPGDLRALLRSCLQFLSASPARFVVANLEDLWLETEPQNVPGTGPERPNWRRRARHRLEQIRGMPEVTDTLAAIDHLRRERGDADA